MIIETLKSKTFFLRKWLIDDFKNLPFIIQASLLITTLLGPIITIGPIFERIITLWRHLLSSISEYLKETFSIELGLIAIATISLFLFLTPLWFNALANFSLKESFKKEYIETSVGYIFFGFIFAQIIVSAHWFFSTGYYPYQALIDGNDVFSTSKISAWSTGILSTLFVFLYFLNIPSLSRFVIILLLSLSIFNLAFVCYAFLWWKSVAIEKLSFAIKMKNDGALSEEALLEYMKLHANVTGMRSSNLIRGFLNLFINIIVISIPIKFFKISLNIMFLVLLYVVYSLYYSFMNFPIS